MSIKLQILIIIVILLAMLYIIRHVRNKSMDFRYALLWLFVCICVLILTVFPKMLTALAEILGIASPVNMLFFLGFCLSIVIIFTLSIALSNLTDKVKKLSQEIAILREDMYERYNSNKE